MEVNGNTNCVSEGRFSLALASARFRSRQRSAKLCGRVKIDLKMKLRLDGEVVIPHDHVEAARGRQVHLYPGAAIEADRKGTANPRFFTLGLLADRNAHRAGVGLLALCLPAMLGGHSNYLRHVSILSRRPRRLQRADTPGLIACATVYRSATFDASWRAVVP